MTITEFLLARIAEDEREANENQKYEVGVYETAGWWSPSRVLAECAAKRAIIGLYRLYIAYSELTDRDPGVRMQMCDHAMTLGEVLPPIAAVYKDHPDYRPEWAL
jgi:hypothetical protein